MTNGSSLLRAARTAESNGNGGSTATSTRWCRSAEKLPTSLRTWSSASGTVRFIFQLPAISGLRATSSPLLVENGQTRQNLALQVLQRRAAPGGDVGEPVLGQAERPDGRGRVAPSDDAERALTGGVDDRLRDPAGALGE